jgi:hypothetical protein
MKPKDYQKQYHEKYPWVRHRFNAIARTKRNGRSMELTIEEIKTLWFRDNASQLTRPSLDRIDNDKGYSFDNCRFIELLENIRLGSLGREVTQKKRDVCRENALKGVAKRWLRTECSKGHPYSGENLRLKKNGNRVCRACEKLRWNRWNKSEAEAARDLLLNL